MTKQEGRPPTVECVYLVTLVDHWLACNLDLDSMTLILDFDLDILKMYQHTENETCRFSLLKVKPKTGHSIIFFDPVTLTLP